MSFVVANFSLVPDEEKIYIGFKPQTQDVNPESSIKDFSIPNNMDILEKLLTTIRPHTSQGDEFSSTDIAVWKSRFIQTGQGKCNCDGRIMGNLEPFYTDSPPYDFEPFPGEQLINEGKHLMENDHIDRLHGEASTRLTSIHNYHEKGQEFARQIALLAFKMEEALKKKYDMLQAYQSQSSGGAIPLDFKVNENIDTTQSGRVNSAMIKNMNAEIDELAKSLNWFFKKAKENHTFISQHHSKLQAVINETYDNFEQLFRNI